MKEKLVAYKLKYETLVTRERVLLLGALLAAVYLLWELFFVSGMTKDQKLLDARERIALQQINTAKAEVSVLEKLAKQDPNNLLRIELDQLKNKLSLLDTNLTELSNGLVSATHLPVVLHDLLKKASEVELLEIKTLPVSEVKLGEKSDLEVDDNTPDLDEEEIKVFRHGVRLRVSGTYRSLYDYLLRIESSSWQFYWEEVKYGVTKYPNALLEVQVYTLSPEQGIFNG